MKKKTIIIVSISVILALLAISVIATFPTYLIDGSENLGENIILEDIQDNSVTKTDPEQGEDVGQVGATPNGGVPSDLPDPDADENDKPTANDNQNQAVAEYYTVFENDGVTIRALKGSMEGYDVTINKLGSTSKTYYRVRRYVKDFSKNWQIFDIQSEKNDKSADPDGTAKAVFEIPKKYDTNKVAVYRVLSDGLMKLNCDINKSDRTVTVNFAKPGIYILVEQKEADKTPSSPTSTPSSSEDTSSTPSSGTNSGTDSSTDSSSSGSQDTSSNTSTVDPNKDTMAGWTPWY